jgi:carbamoyltransferase
LARYQRKDWIGASDLKVFTPETVAILSYRRWQNIGIDDVDLFVCGSSIRLCKSQLLTYLPVQSDRVCEIPVPGHHLAHAYSAFGTCPFTEPAVMVIDEQGHYLSDHYEKCSWYEAADCKLVELQKFYGDKRNISLGLFYNIFAALTGLSEAGFPAAGKLMGLAPFGRAHPEWPRLIKTADSGETEISLDAIEAFFQQIGVDIRPEGADLTVREADHLLAKYYPISWKSELGVDIAYKAQEELQAGVLESSNLLKKRSTKQSLCFAGGVALNCMANSQLAKSGWHDVYVHPAATDDGAAIGLAYYGWIEVLKRERQPIKFSPFTGRRYEINEIKSDLDHFGISDFAKNTAVDAIATELSTGAIVCWFDGSSEWGPRALGARSIAGNPLLPSTATLLNRSVKFREPFRPFGISTTAEAANQLLDLREAPLSLAPYMLSVARPRDSRLKSIAHVDGTVRYQVVDKSVQPNWHSLIEAFGAITGVEAIVNTSFNIYGEPLVETPRDAIRQFLISKANILALQEYMIHRSDIPPDVLAYAWENAFKETMLSPLETAISLCAAGYIEEALTILQCANYTENSARCDGSAAYLRYKRILILNAIARNDSNCAVQHAGEALEIIGLSALTREMLQCLVSHAERGGELWTAAATLHQIADPGDLWKFFLKSVHQ